MYPQPQFRIMGDSALLVELGDGIAAEINDRVSALWNELESRRISGILEMVPAYRSLMIVYDPLSIALPALKNKIMAVWATMDPERSAEAEIVEVPVVYGGEYGPDLEWVSAYHKVSADSIITLHTDTIYRVYMIGFTPGYPYMGELPEALATPRRDTPRTHVPKGAVGIAQRQTGIYPTESPGGWQIIGRTPMTLFDPADRPPALLKMGDRVKFYAIGPEEFDQWLP
jgi:inhibitor of KinA